MSSAMTGDNLSVRSGTTCLVRIKENNHHEDGVSSIVKDILHKSVKVKMPEGKPAGRIICPRCGNSSEFFEVAEGVHLSTRYVQNIDGSFSPLENESEVQGEIRLYCGQCSADISQFHQHFLDMVF